MSNVLIEGRVVVCSACRCKPDDSGEWFVVAGVRHFDMVMHHQIDRAFNGEDTTHLDWEQGFLDQYGIFMDRVEALAVATAAKQINTRRSKTAPEHELFSEDVW